MKNWLIQKWFLKKFIHERQEMNFEVDAEYLSDAQKFKNSMGTVQLTSVRIKPSQKASIYVILIRY